MLFLNRFSRHGLGFWGVLLAGLNLLGADAPSVLDQPAATARGVTITRGRVEKLLQGPLRFRYLFRKPADLTETKREVATEACAGDLFLQALSEPVRKELAEKVATEFRDWRGTLPNEQAFADAVAKSGETVEDGQWRRLRFLATERYLKDQMPAPPAPTEAAIEALYRDPERRREFFVPEERQVRWLRVEFPEEAEPAVIKESKMRCEKLRALAGPEGLTAQLAETPGEPQAEFGKSVERLWDEALLDGEERLHLPVLKAAKATAKGVISEVGFSEWEHNHFMVQVDAITPGRILPLEEVRPRLVAELTEQSDKRAREEFTKARLAAAGFKLLPP